jgi:hypothetical protein
LFSVICVADFTLRSDSQTDVLDFRQSDLQREKTAGRRDPGGC